MKSLYKNTLLVSAFLVAIAGSVFAQTPLTSYFIESSYMRNQLNPALRPNSGYVGIPALSGVSIDYKTNTFNLDNFTFEKKINGQNERVTFMHPAVGAKEFMSNISEDNYLSYGTSLDLLSFGWYKGSTFWNVNISLKENIDFNVPKSFFRLMKEGYSQDEQTNYDLEGISSTGNLLTEIGLSYSRPILNDALTIGVRAKILGGIANWDLHAEQLSIDAGPDYWRAKSQVKLAISAPGIKPKYNSSGILDGFGTGDWGQGLSGYGFGLDLGAVGDLGKLFPLPVLKNVRASIALTDIGFISWSKDNTIQLKSKATDISIPSEDRVISDEASLEDVFEDVIDDINEAVNLQEDRKGGRSTSLRSTLNVGVEYLMLDNKLSAGLLYSNRFGNYYNTQELTVSGNFRPTKWLAASLSYSFLHSQFDTFGGALYLTPSKFLNIFVAGDYVIPNVSPQYYPSTTKALNLQFGISIPI
ncbi:MAG: DUF5723 family protein [Prevotella sp.]|jgi:hypothetical protein|nr:DUF5723 family protein [Prevotella sp.]